MLFPQYKNFFTALTRVWLTENHPMLRSSAEGDATVATEQFVLIDYVC